MKKFQFFKNFLENFAIFSYFFIFSHFWRNLDKNLEICVSSGFGGGGKAPPRRQRIYGNDQKNQWKSSIFGQFSRNFSNFFQIFKGFYRIFRVHCANNLGKYGYMHFQGVRGLSPPNLENFKKSYSKIQWKPPIF